jgi:hypothetical protein
MELVMTATLRLYVPNASFVMQGDVCEADLPKIARALTKELPVICAYYGRVAAIVENNGVSHIIKSMRSPR